MTIWLEKSTVQQYLVNPTGAEASIRFDCGEDKCTVFVEFLEKITLDELKLTRWVEFCRVLSDGSPEYSLEAKNGNIVACLTVDSNVCRRCS